MEPRFLVGHGAVQVASVSHREALDGALLHGLGQPVQHQLLLL